MRLMIACWTTVALVLYCAAAVAQPLATLDWELDDGASGWETFGDQAKWLADDGHEGAGCLHVSGASEVAGAAREIPQELLEACDTEGYGQGDFSIRLKVRMWIRCEDATGDSYAALELQRAGQEPEVLGRTGKLSGTPPGWIPRSFVATVPAGRDGAQVRLVLRSTGNSGRAWFDDVRVMRLGPNAPKLSSEPPVPARGQVTVEGESFVDAEGKRIRLWGVNCVDEMVSDYEESRQVIHRIKQMGFNAIRLHLYDVRLIDPDATNEQGEPTSRVFRKRERMGDGSMIDLFDHFIYWAEANGLYLYLTFDRLRVPFKPGDYDIMPAAGPDDEKAWKAAVAATNQSGANEHLYFADERLGAVQAEYVRQQLDHLNPYTGRRIADDPFVAIYELTNENGFPDALLEGSSGSWPEYFRSVLQRRWNSWLKDRYGSDEALRAAWGSVGEGEGLVAGTVRFAPTGGEANKYPAARLADVRQFVYDLTIGYSRNLEDIIRKAGRCSADAPVTYDTIYKHRHTWYYPMSQGTCQAVGTYESGRLDLKREDSWLGNVPTNIYNLSNATVAGKPIVVYETNILKPAADRAYYPMLVSTYASTHGWDAVFWYNWSNGTVNELYDDEAYDLIGLRYAVPEHTWHGIVSSTDEVLLSGMRLGGEIFKRGLIPPAPDPVTITIGRNDLLGSPSWIGDVSIPYPKDAPGPYVEAAAIGATDFKYTCRYKYDMSAEKSSVSAPLIARAPTICEPVEGVRYDFARGLIEVDRPEVKAVVGFTDGNWSTADGLSVSAPGCPFFCWGLLSTDGKPLRDASEALVTWGTYGENRGRVLREDPDSVTANVSRHAKLVAEWGYGPPDLARPALQMSLPWDAKLEGVDFRSEALPEVSGETLSLPEGQRLFTGRLSR